MSQQLLSEALQLASEPFSA